MSTADWSYREVNAEHATLGLTYHVEALAFRGASLADMLSAAARAVVVVTDEAPVSSAAPTVAPTRKAA